MSGQYCGLCGEPHGVVAGEPHGVVGGEPHGVVGGQPEAHPACVQRLALEPPRYCEHCRRRMVVQVHPTGWSARCVEHGTVTG